VIYPGSTPVGNATLVVANVLTCNKYSHLSAQMESRFQVVWRPCDARPTLDAEHDLALCLFCVTAGRVLPPGPCCPVPQDGAHPIHPQV
jgi:hypothetical protein